MISTARVVSLVVVLVAGAALMGAVGPAAAAGRPASSVVNVDSTAFASGGFVPIGTGEPLIVYEVPRGFWLLVTDVEVAGSFGIALVEIDGHALTTKRGARFNSDSADPSGAGTYHSSVGLAFAPGSLVALRNVSGAEQTAAFTLTGQLTRD